VSFLYGVTRGKFAFRVLEHQVAFKNLPSALQGLRVVQISDAHLGSFMNNFDPIKEAIQMVNELKPDLIMFTGDLVMLKRVKQSLGFRSLKSSKRSMVNTPS